MKHPNQKSRRFVFAALVATTALTATTASASVSVRDWTGVSRLAGIQSLETQQTQELGEIRNLEQEQLSAIGEFGPLRSIFGGAGGTASGSEASFYENMENFGFDPCTINLCEFGNDPVGTTDISEAREWAITNFFAGDALTPDEAEDLDEIRRRGVVSAAVDGVALATIIQNELTSAGDQAASLEELAASANNLRENVQTNSAILLAQYKVQLQQLAIMASVLEVEAMNAVAGTSMYHEDGGTRFANAFIEEDFSEQDQSIRLRVTNPGSGAAGGGGMGGGLFGSTNSGAATSILGGTQTPVGEALTNGQNPILSGAAPTIDPDQITREAVTADAASVAAIAMDDDPAVPEMMTSAVEDVRDGLSQGGTQGRSEALMGLAQANAAGSGNTALAGALATGSQAVSSNNTQGAINFLDGVIADITANGLNVDLVNYLEDRKAGLENGTVDVPSAVLDASAILSSAGANPNAAATEILQVDPAVNADDFYQLRLSDVIRLAGQISDNPDLIALSDDVRSIEDSDIAQLQETAAASQTSEDQQ